MQTITTINTTKIHLGVLQNLIVVGNSIETDKKKKQYVVGGMNSVIIDLKQKLYQFWLSRKTILSVLLSEAKQEDIR